MALIPCKDCKNECGGDMLPHTFKYYLFFMLCLVPCLYEVPAYADDLSIDHPLAIGECDYTKDRTKKICMDSDGRYKILPTSASKSGVLANVIKRSHINANGAATPISCKNVDYGSLSYQEYQRNMTQLAALAKLPDAYWSRYIEDIVADLCTGTTPDIVAINASIDYGYVTAQAAESIARVFGKNYTAPARTENGILYEKINKGLLDLGICTACASNIAGEYVKHPDGNLAKLVKAALAGDKSALEQLSQDDNAVSAATNNPAVIPESHHSDMTPATFSPRDEKAIMWGFFVFFGFGFIGLLCRFLYLNKRKNQSRSLNATILTPCIDCGHKFSADAARCTYCGTVRSLTSFKINVNACRACYRQFSTDKGRCPYCKDIRDLSGGRISGTILLATGILVGICVLFLYNPLFSIIGFIVFLFGSYVIYTDAEGTILQKEQGAEQKAKEQQIIEKNIFNIIEQHIATLARKKRQLLIADEYGVVESAPWQNELERFNTRVLQPQAGEWPNVISLIEQQVEEYSENNTSLDTEFSDAMNPYDYELYCANLLSDIGWNARATKASGDQGSDVIAEKNGIKIVLQCKLYTQPVGNKAIQEVFAAKSHEQANHAAVVTNQTFTRSARQIAATTGVDLLHHEQIQSWAKSLIQE